MSGYSYLISVRPHDQHRALPNLVSQTLYLLLCWKKTGQAPIAV